MKVEQSADSPRGANKYASKGSEMLRDLQRRQRERAFLITFIVVSLISATLSFFFATELATQLTANWNTREIPNNAIIIRFVSASALVAVAGLITYLYASGLLVPTITADHQNTRSLDMASLATAVDAIVRAAQEIKNNRYLTEEDRNIISKQVEAFISDTLPKEYFAKIDEKYGQAIKNEKLSSYVEEFLGITKSRLIRFQSDLSRKAASSLAWGLVTAILGLLVLALFIYMPPQGAWDIGTAFHLVARLSLVAIIEVVAFFFLSQYRFTLQDQKYLNNEVTNTELRLLSLITSAKLGSKPAIEKALSELSRTERNFALKKGEISVFSSGSGGDLLQSAVVADLIARLVPGTSMREKPKADK